jgi:hypothetical protein
MICHFSQNRAILAYKNVIVDLINDYLLDLFHDGSKPAPHLHFAGLL